jgi:hypothetical protein
VAVKLWLVGASEMSGLVGAATVNVTEMFCGLFGTPAAVTGMVAVYVPAASAPVVTPIVTVAGAVATLRAAVAHPVAPAP